MLRLCTKCQLPEPQLRGELFRLRTFWIRTIVDGSEKTGSLGDSESGICAG